MKIHYSWNKSMMNIKEVSVSTDMEFTIQVLAEPYFDKMRQVQKFFESNDVITDVFVYPYANHEYRVVVRNDFYEDFIIELFRNQMLTKVEWI